MAIDLTARNAAVRRVLLWILVANWAVAALKVALGLWARSTAMTADGLHSFIDGGSNVVGLVAMHYANQPADEEHPYGHQKFEALAALAIGVMIGMGVLELGQVAFAAIVRNVHPQVGPESIALMMGTLVVNLLVTRYEKREGERLRSSLLVADASHTLSDVYVTISVIVSLGLSWLGVGRADGVVALGVLVFVAWTGWGIIKQAAGILADMRQIDPQRVRDACAGVPQVLGVRQVRSRGLEGSVYVDLTIDVDPQLTVQKAHDAADQVEQLITRTFPEVVEVLVHVEPRTND
jgi:cation diffusion facilitator family transporter